MSDTLKDQAIDLEIKRLLDLGALPYEIYESVSRCSDDVRATDEEIKEAVALCESVDYHILDANPWVSRGEPDEYDDDGDGDPKPVVWVHVWLRLGDE